MAIPFTQSMRSVQADRGRSSLIGVGIAILFFALWATWFFFAPIVRYETGTIVGITRNDRIVAEFPILAIDSIRRGQVAHIRPHGFIHDDSGDEAIRLSQDQMGSMPAIVAEVIGPTSQNSFEVEFYVQWNKAFVALFERASSGEVEVEVESLTPATLVARASGQLMEAPALSFTPRNRP